nr:MAG TPA: hypothetical protein [Caudoviricetes sp.]
METPCFPPNIPTYKFSQKPHNVFLYLHIFTFNRSAPKL